jgi:acetyl esterase/lipase
MKCTRQTGWITQHLSSLVLSTCAVAITLALAVSSAQAFPFPSDGVTGLKPFTVKELRDIAYREGKDADTVRHRLDLYLPAGKKDFPVLILVHGGAWIMGDKNFFGWGTDLGECFARQGIGVVMPSYRLAPAVKYTDQVKDVADALAWTHANIARYGGNRDQLFLCGHSAGGHLVSLLATDARYLKAVGLPASVIKGVVAVSGVYQVPEVNFNLLGNSQASGMSLSDLAQAVGLSRGEDEEKGQKPRKEMPLRLGVRLNLFGNIFGDDPKVRQEASPLAHVRPGLPPFLIVYCTHDLPLLPGMAVEFSRALKAAHVDVDIIKVDDRNHESVMFDAHTPDDPVARAIRRFLGHCPEKDQQKK